MLCDWLLTHRKALADVSVLEIGSGVGLVAITAAHCCRHVIATDYRDDVCARLQHNLDANRHLRQAGGSDTPIVRKLNLLTRENLPWAEPREPDPGPYEWSSRDLQAAREARLLLASDVIYDDRVTRAFFLALREALQPGDVLYMSLEKRIIFSAEELRIAAPAHECLNSSGICHNHKDKAQIIRCTCS